ncbi:MAG TPA: hypothetical protein VFL13_05740 [Candidatus Baltobacteraceae bacterium]|nr:hypothetical protein [Candidatus Baltobacteraceae bacterium]
MNTPQRVIPLIVDENELHLRLPVRKADDRAMRQAGAALPVLKIV